MKSIFDRLQGKDYAESYSSPLSIRTLRKSAEANKDKIEAVREDMSWMTMREAMTTDELAGYVPEIFSDPIIQLGLRERIAVNAFGTRPQPTNSSFKTRFRSKGDGAQILRELDDFKHSKSERETVEWHFNKIGDMPMWSFEMLTDSVLNEIQDELLFSASNIYRRENQLAAHRLCEWSQGVTGLTWDNVVLNTSEYDDLTGLKAAIQSAYLNMTSRLTDRFGPESLRIFWGSEVFALFFADEDTRRWDILGQSPTQVTGRIPNYLGMQSTIWEPGYFNADSEWTPCPYDVYICAMPYTMAFKERVALRIDEYVRQQNQSRGIQLWERLAPYILNPLAYRRITVNATYADIIGDMKDILVGPADD